MEGGSIPAANTAASAASAPLLSPSAAAALLSGGSAQWQVFYQQKHIWNDSVRLHVGRLARHCWPQSDAPNLNASQREQGYQASDSEACHHA